MNYERAVTAINHLLKQVWKLWVGATAVIGSLLVLGLVGFSIVAGDSGTTREAPLPSQTIRTPGSGGKIAVVELSGVIVDQAGGDVFSSADGVVAAQEVIPLLKHVANDDEVKAVVLRINSPGGAVVPSDEIYRAVLELRKKKPVVTSMADVAASGGYYIAAGTDSIIANPATITGSIGVIAEFPELAGLYEKVGIEMRTFKSGDFKDLGSLSRDITPAESEILQSVITDSYDQFVAAIVAGRKMDEAKVRTLADGRIYTGQQAKEKGLVDELGNVEMAINTAAKLANVTDPAVVEYSSDNFFSSLFSAAAPVVSPLARVEKYLPATHGGLYYLLQW